MHKMPAVGAGRFGGMARNDSAAAAAFRAVAGSLAARLSVLEYGG